MTPPTFDQDFADRPDSMMDLLADHAIKAAPVAQPAPVRHLPNRRALAVLDQMYAYHDQEPLTDVVDFGYDDAAA